MERCRYDYIGNKVWEILIEQKIDKLPIDIIKICKNMDIDVIESSFRSCSIDYHDKNIINFDEKIKKYEKIRFLIGHELGHIMLNQENGSYSEKEHEANLFARKLLAPLGIIYNAGINTPDDISQLCDVSKMVALKRYYRLIKENIIHRYGENSLENEVIHNFDNFLKAYREQKNTYEIKNILNVKKI